MVVRVSYCRWHVSCESPHGMFLCVLYSGTKHMPPSEQTGAYIYTFTSIYLPKAPGPRSFRQTSSSSSADITSLRAQLKCKALKES